MAGGRISIGYVTTKDAFARDRREHPSSDELYGTLSQSRRPCGPDRGAEFLGGTRVETDYSYIADQFCGPGYAIVGDAACFLDPLLSTGVHLALYSALTAAACVASMDRGEVSETEALRFFEFAYRRAYMRLSRWWVSYERYLGKDGFFLTSDRLIGDEQSVKAEEGVSSRSFAEIIGGLSDLREAAHSSTRVITDQLRVEAVGAQMRSVRAPDSVGPDSPRCGATPSPMRSRLTTVSSPARNSASSGCVKRAPDRAGLPGQEPLARRARPRRTRDRPRAQDELRDAPGPAGTATSPSPTGSRPSWHLLGRGV